MNGAIAIINLFPFMCYEYAHVNGLRGYAPIGSSQGREQGRRRFSQVLQAQPGPIGLGAVKLIPIFGVAVTHGHIGLGLNRFTKV